MKKILRDLEIDLARDVMTANFFESSRILARIFRFLFFEEYLGIFATCPTDD